MQHSNNDIQTETYDIHSISFFAMGCHNQVHLELSRIKSLVSAEVMHEHLAQLEQRILSKLAHWEGIFSRFDGHSELMQLNKRSGEWVAVSQALYEVIQQAFVFYQQTQGLVTPTVLQSMQQIGYQSSFETLKKCELNFSCNRSDELNHQQNLICSSADNTTPNRSKNSQTPTRPLPLERQIRLRHKVSTDDGYPTIYEVYLADGVGIDLNGYVKGWAANKLAKQISTDNRRPLPCLVNLGGDIAVGTVDNGTVDDIDKVNWTVAIASPNLTDSAKPNSELSRLKDDVAIFDISTGGVATSGQDYRRWWHKGKPQHHIINPYDNQSAVSDVLTVTVIAEDALIAEVCAKYCLIMGQHSALEWLQDNDIAGLIINTQHQVMTSPAMNNYL
ncbi:FAD:protein FMN transferase [Psychrobacter sp. FDAARGOS_221]|uniref:FAD:protein FMN transferase n=1 Tax=Psychrobacter sp. FDAARGOS_221 TaxID=1975705 RepID=UPI000BB5517C|nr:FAD:protein FMN transferase [Psychrobacter sp. FDAARGOS_221]PNK59622.1 FAD:protein FMN transferase [Psychrobacter sp. FDAARGOS_221]